MAKYERKALHYNDIPGNKIYISLLFFKLFLLVSSLSYPILKSIPFPVNNMNVGALTRLLKRPLYPAIISLYFKQSSEFMSSNRPFRGANALLITLLFSLLVTFISNQFETKSFTFQIYFKFCMNILFSPQYVF